MFNLPTAGSLTFAGEMAALSAAFLWAFSSFLFSRLGNTIPPIEMNFLKGILAAALFTATLFILGDPVSNLTLQTVLILAVSGAIGIGFGDTMYFEALNLLGPRRTLLVTTLAPVFTALLAWVFLDETLNLLAVAGIFLTIAGIAWVITEQQKDSGQDSSHIRKGIFYAFLAAMTQAIGAVLSRWVLTGTQTSALHSALVRLVAGILFIVIWVAVKRQPVGQWVKTRSTPRLWGTVAVVVVLGTYLAIWLQQVAFQFTRVGIAQTLLATSPLFVLPISALQREGLSLRSITGVFVAVAGIALMFLPG
jgi:drug/metabolite transporter (DMT)-like permease